MIYAGCSGYSFKEWVGHFYPPKTKSKDYLEHYARKLNSVEINHTFRRFPRLEVIEAWAEKTPEHFRFSFKMHQSVTHMARLKNVGRSVSDFLDALMPLKKRLGVVLFQLPPFFKLNHERLDSFLGELPAGFRYAMEFRHASWSEPAVVEKLTVAGVALCGSELEIDATEIVQTAPVHLSASQKTASVYGRGDRDLARARAGSGRRCGRPIRLCETRRCGRRSGAGGAHRHNLKPV